MILTKHFMMTARLECTDRWPAPHLYFKRLSHPGWLASDGATPKPAHSKLECRKRGRNRKSSLWCIFLKKNMCFLSYNCSSVHRPIPFNAFEIVGEKGIFASSVPQTLEKRSASAFISSPERALWLGHAIKTLSTHNTHT